MTNEKLTDYEKAELLAKLLISEELIEDKEELLAPSSYAYCITVETKFTEREKKFSLSILFSLYEVGEVLSKLLDLEPILGSWLHKYILRDLLTDLKNGRIDDMPILQEIKTFIKNAEIENLEENADLRIYSDGDVSLDIYNIYL